MTLDAFAVTVDSVEHATGIDSFPRCPIRSKRCWKARSGPPNGAHGNRNSRRARHRRVGPR